LGALGGGDGGYRLATVHLVDAYLCTEPAKCASGLGIGLKGGLGAGLSSRGVHFLFAVAVVSA